MSETKIITLDKLNPYSTPYWQSLRKRYEEDEDFRQRADRIHAQRMLPPPTCNECMESAAHEDN